MTLPANIQAAIKVLALSGLSAEYIAPYFYRQFVRFYPDTPPPLFGASPKYWVAYTIMIALLLGLLMTAVHTWALLIGEQRGSVGAARGVFIAGQTLGWALCGVVGWLVSRAVQRGWQRDATLMALPAWNAFNDQWRPTQHYSAHHADLNRYWLRALWNAPTVRWAGLFGIVAYLLVNAFNVKTAHTAAEIVALVMIIQTFIDLNLTINGKVMPSRLIAYFVAKGFWLGFLVMDVIWSVAISDILLLPKSHATLVCLLIIATLHIYERMLYEQRRYIKVHIERAEQDKQIAEMRVLALKAQIEPHFIFNTLAHLKALIREDARAAEAMADDLADFLRASTKALGATRLRLADEGALVNSYLALVKRRMGKRLTSDILIHENAAHVLLPPWMLLTLVENAVKHGIEPKLGNGRIDVAARCINEAGQQRLHICVQDDGVGFGIAQQSLSGGTGVGLANVRERLRSMYGDAANLTLRANTPSGVVAEIVMPIEKSGENE